MKLRTSALCVLLVVAIGLGGCSFIFATDAPPPEIAARQAETEGRIRCTRAPALPIVDTVVAGVQALRVLLAFIMPDDFYEAMPYSREVDIGVGLGLLGIYTASSVYGFGVVEDCRAVYDEYLPGGPVSFGNPPPVRGCTSDVECKGARVCIEGRCTELR